MCEAARCRIPSRDVTLPHMTSHSLTGRHTSSCDVEAYNGTSPVNLFIRDVVMLLISQLNASNSRWIGLVFDLSTMYAESQIKRATFSIDCLYMPQFSVYFLKLKWYFFRPMVKRFPHCSCWSVGTYPVIWLIWQEYEFKDFFWGGEYKMLSPFFSRIMISHDIFAGVNFEYVAESISYRYIRTFVKDFKKFYKIL